MSSMETQTQYPAGKLPAIRQVMMPRDTNSLGSIFGGVILSQIDLAASQEAYKQHPGKVVTVAMDKIEFKRPVFVGDAVSFFTETIKVGRTSIRVKVSVWANRRDGANIYVTEAIVTMVAVDDDLKPVPVKKP